MLRQSLIMLSALVVFGIAVPWIKGYAFLDPLLLIGYACIGVLFIVPAATDIASLPEPRPLLLKRASLILGYGVGVALMLLVSGILTVNFRAWQGGFVVPSRRFLTAAIVLGAAACFAVIGAAMSLSRALGSQRAKAFLRTGLLLLLLGLAFGYNHLPEGLRETIDTNLTTVGLTAFALRAAAFLASAGAALTAWAVSRATVKLSTP